MEIPNLYKGTEKPGNANTEDISKVESFRYPYNNASYSPKAEITLTLNREVGENEINAYIPLLKYNKSWLFMLSQDDCMQSAYSHTFAAINGGAISAKYYYNMEHLRLGDLPPDIYYMDKTLGSIDAAGNEVRFSFMTTVAPQWNFMNTSTPVKIGYTKDWYRFYMQSGLSWKNLTEMMNFGTAIAFHDVKAKDVNITDSIVKNLILSQDIIKEKLNGRSCKVMAEPNGNKTYIRASLLFDDIKVITAQTGTEAIIPASDANMTKKILHRDFFSLDNIKSVITDNLHKDIRERSAIHYAIHNTSADFAKFLLWLNDTYGKDGDNSVWMTSLEEYYEYVYLRENAGIITTCSDNIIKISVTLPSENNFYYPSVTINIDGIDAGDIVSVESNNAITGLGYGSLQPGTTALEIDCRSSLNQQAEYFVALYEEKKDERRMRDALYFVNRLKESDFKNSLLKRIR